MISMRTPLLSYIWLTILVCLATCNYDLANGVNPFDTHFFKVKRKNPKSSFLPSLNPFDNRQIDNNFTRSESYQLESNPPIKNNFHGRYNHNPHRNLNNLNIDIKGHHTRTTSQTTSGSLFINNYNRGELDMNSLEQQLAESNSNLNSNPSSGPFQQLYFESSLNCEPKIFPQYAENIDEIGRRCWGTIPVQGCLGRCDTGEYADWKFPFKKSFHRVCIHKLSKFKIRILENCDPGVDENLRKYLYLNAETCACQVCKSNEVSCEGLNYHATPATYFKKSGGERIIECPSSLVELNRHRKQVECCEEYNAEFKTGQRLNKSQLTASDMDFFAQAI